MGGGCNTSLPEMSGKSGVAIAGILSAEPMSCDGFFNNHHERAEYSGYSIAVKQVATTLVLFVALAHNPKLARLVGRRLRSAKRAVCHKADLGRCQ